MKGEQQRSPEQLEEQRIATWLQIGGDNYWIQQSWDPPFGWESFCRCKTVDQLADQLLQGNWCVGQAFYYDDLCLINQVDGGHEWLTIRHGIASESISFGVVERQEGREAVTGLLDRLLAASKEDCMRLEY